MNRPVNFTTNNCFLSFLNDQNEILCEFYLAEVHLQENDGNLHVSDNKPNNAIWLDKKFFDDLSTDIASVITTIETARTNCLPALELNLENGLTFTTTTATGPFSIGAQMHQIRIENVGNADGLVNGGKIGAGTVLQFDGMYVGNQYLTLPSFSVDGTGTELVIHTLS